MFLSPRGVRERPYRVYPQIQPLACPLTILSAFGLIGIFFLPTHGLAQDLRIVAYNIEADITVNGTSNPNGTPLPGLSTVLEAIGEQTLGSDQQPISILGLEETTSNTGTIAPIVSSLNSYYGGSLSNPSTPYYAASTYQGTESGGNPGSGNGPNAMIYNENAVTLLSSTGVPNTPYTTGTVGAYRQVVRYEFQPVGGTSANDFYIYVSHMKSGTTTTDMQDRAAEASAIQANVATLPSNSSVILEGDFNITGGSSESAYSTLTGLAVDPLGGNFSSNADLTETDTSLKYRDDIQFMSSNIYNSSSSAALDYISGSYEGFGNNGSTAYGTALNQSSNTALNNLSQLGSYPLITGSTALAEMSQASDHLPVVADYSFVAAPEPGSLALMGGGAGFVLLAARGVSRRRAQSRS